MQWSTFALKVAPSATSEINPRDPIQSVGIQNTQNKDALHFDKRTFVVVYNWIVRQQKIKRMFRPVVFVTRKQCHNRVFYDTIM